MNRGSRPYSNSKFVASLGYMRACPNIPEKKSSKVHLGSQDTEVEELPVQGQLGLYSKTVFPKQTPYKPVGEVGSTHKTRNVPGGYLHYQCPSG